MFHVHFNPYKQSLQFHFILSMASHFTNYNIFKIEDLTRLVFSYEIYERSLRRVLDSVYHTTLENLTVSYKMNSISIRKSIMDTDVVNNINDTR